MGVSKNRGTPKWMVYNPIKMDDLGVPLFLETPISTTSECISKCPDHVITETLGAQRQTRTERSCFSPCQIRQVRVGTQSPMDPRRTVGVFVEDEKMT